MAREDWYGPEGRMERVRTERHGLIVVASVERAVRRPGGTHSLTWVPIAEGWSHARAAERAVERCIARNEERADRIVGERRRENPWLAAAASAPPAKLVTFEEAHERGAVPLDIDVSSVECEHPECGEIALQQPVWVSTPWGVPVVCRRHAEQIALFYGVPGAKSPEQHAEIVWLRVVMRDGPWKPEDYGRRLEWLAAGRRGVAEAPGGEAA